MLDDKSFMRYSRQLLLEEIGPEGQQKLSDARILIVGLGGWVHPPHYISRRRVPVHFCWLTMMICISVICNGRSSTAHQIPVSVKQNWQRRHFAP